MAAPKGNLFALGNNGGRESDYDESFCSKLIIHMSEGLSFESFAGEVGCCPKTLHNWKDKHKEFLHSYNVGVGKSMLWWEKIMKTHLVYSMRGKRIDPRMWEFNMKNRFKDYWKDKTEQEVNQTNTNVAANFGTTLQSSQESGNDSPIDKE
jgi:hypothetical protein